ncbi:MAG: SDR family NAD(P)-dependent oxidoreductase, partial [Bacillota bacterium]|nr:SDR family NAD(P)-dependent oxidoreductase [Bacillota bacterium]
MKSTGKIKRNIGEKTVKANSLITENSTSKDVAIVGIACRFPGANNYDEFWRNLECGVDSVREVPPERWSAEEYYSRNIDEPNKSNSKWFGVVDNIDQFDNGFFNISPREAKNMDPQQRILMEETWRCIEDSGIPLSKLQNAVTSVIVGAMAIDYYQNIHSPNAQIDGYAGMGVYHSMLSNRLSYFLGFRGESKTVDTACSSTLSALYDARQLLYLDQCDYALVASVNLNINPSRNIMWAKNRMLSPEGKCKTFDKDANGFVSGEGAGVLLLRPLYKAVEEKNNIYGVIKGIAINHGGRSRAFTVPKVASQRDVILAAYEDSGISADTITYVEAHGTGTSLGDPIEIEALTQAFRKYTRRNCYCKIGSVKTNIGHLESASGAAGLFKVLMMLKHRKIPRTLNINTINPIIDFKETPFSPATELDVWKSAGEGMPLRAGISAFGLGGVNVHVVVEEYKVKKEVIEEEDICDNLFVLSAKSTDSLKMMLTEWNAFIESERLSTLSLHEICRTMLTGRNAFSYRWGKIVKSKKELVQRLKEADIRDAHKKSEKPWCLMAGDVSLEERFRLARLTKERKLFSGVLELVKSAAMELEDGEKLWEGLLDNRTEEGLRSLFPFIGSFTLLTTLKELGLSPAMVTGCKNGTWAALALSGMMALKDILRLLSGAGELRSMEIRRPIVSFYDPIEGATLKPFKFDKEYLNFIRDGLADGMKTIYDDCVAKARLLLDNQYTFKRYMEEWCEAFKKFGLDLDKVLYSEKPGTGDDLDEAEKLLLLAAIISSLQKLNRKWDFTRKTSASNKKFAELLDLVTDEVMPPEGLIELLVSANPDCEALACKLDERQDRMNLANPYLYIRNFSKNITEKKDVYHWIEELLSGETIHFENITSKNIAVIGDIPEGQVPAAVNLGMKTGDELEKVLLELWLSGADVKWSNLYVDGSFYRVPLPTYSFNREVFWMECKTDVHTGEALHPLIEKNISDFNGVAFESLFTGKEFFLAHHVVNLQKILPGVAYLEAGRASGEFAAKKQAKYLRKITWLRPFILSDTCNRLKIDVRTEDQNGIICEFSTQDVNKQRVVCANLEVIFGDLTDHREYFDFEAVKRRCNYSLQGNDCYDFFNSISLKYGESFTTIKEFWCNENEAVSRLELSNNYVDRLDSFVMHPGIMDGALQTVLNLIYYKISNIKRPFMPFSMEELEIVSEVKQKGFAYVKAAENNLYHVALLDEEGSVCIKMKGISFREVKADDEFFYMPVWMPMQPEQSNRIADSGVGGEGNILIVYPQDEFALKKQLTDCHKQEKVFSIILGEQTRQLSESDWEINIKEPLAIDSCMSSMGEVQSVYFLGGTSVQPSDILNLELIDQSVERYLLSLLRLVKSLNDRGYSAKHLNIKIVTHNVYRITGNDGINPLGAALNGMAKSIAMEYGRWRMCCIDTDYSGASNEELTGQVRGVMDEPWNNKGEIVALRNEQRYERKINPVLLPPIEDNPFRSCGVYLIIGGGGGIGLELGRYLATEVQARLVLVGRSEPDPVRRKAMEDIESAGGKVTYIQADVCDMVAMKKVIEKTKELYGRINGVFHSAIVLRDKSIGNMEEETLLSVLAPKVRGSVVLMKALEGESLDFVMFFSSVQSFMGNSGQSNYAAACAFKDAFAGYQGRERSYKIRTINWGYWGSVGIVATEEYSKRLSAKGLKSIRPEEGMEAIKRALLHHGDQLVAMKADKHFLESIGGDADSTWEAYPAVMEPILNARLNINNQPLIESAVLEQSHLGLKRLEEL